MTPAAPGRVLGSVAPDVLPSHQHHCNVDKWRSLDVRCGVGRPPTMENGPYAVKPPWRTDLWSRSAKLVHQRDYQQVGCYIWHGREEPEWVEPGWEEPEWVEPGWCTSCQALVNCQCIRYCSIYKYTSRLKTVLTITNKYFTEQRQSTCMYTGASLLSSTHILMCCIESDTKMFSNTFNKPQSSCRLSLTTVVDRCQCYITEWETQWGILTDRHNPVNASTPLYTVASPGESLNNW